MLKIIVSSLSWTVITQDVRRTFLDYLPPPFTDTPRSQSQWITNILRQSGDRRKLTLLNTIDPTWTAGKRCEVPFTCGDDRPTDRTIRPSARCQESYSLPACRRSYNDQTHSMQNRRQNQRPAANTQTDSKRLMTVLLTGHRMTVVAFSRVNRPDQPVNQQLNLYIAPPAYVVQLRFKCVFVNENYHNRYKDRG